MNQGPEIHPSVWSEDPVINKVAQLASEAANGESCRLYDVEVTGSPQGKVLRVYIDHPERLVGIEDCSNVSRRLNALLDEHDPIQGGAYFLEVSSPGVDRHLKYPWHFQTAVGKEIKFRLGKSLGELGASLPQFQAQKQVKEILKSSDGSFLYLELGGQEMKIPISEVQKAQVVFSFGNDKSNPRGHQGKRGK